LLRRHGLGPPGDDLRVNRLRLLRRLRRRFDLAHLLLEALEGFAHTFADLRQLARSEDDQDDRQDQDQFCHAHRTEHMITLTARSDWCQGDRKSTRLNSSHVSISYAVFCLKKKKKNK